jgi:hypothetical protein
MTLAAIIALIVLVVIAKLTVDGLLLLFAKDHVANWPELRKEWLGGGSWVAFSRRFGLPYAVAMIIGSFAWVLAAARFMPNTNSGVWLLFGPSISMLVVGVVLAALCTARWIARS